MAIDSTGDKYYIGKAVLWVQICAAQIRDHEATYGLPWNTLAKTQPSMQVLECEQVMDMP